MRLRRCWPMPADPPASTNGPIGIATVLGWSLARPPKTPESPIGRNTSVLGGARHSARRALRSQCICRAPMTPVSDLGVPSACPFGSLPKAPGGLNRCSCELPTPRSLVPGVPRAVPHSGHRTRLQAQWLVLIRSWLRRDRRFNGHPILRRPQPQPPDDRHSRREFRGISLRQ